MTPQKKARARKRVSGGATVAALETERRFLDSHRDELLREYGGKFLVIKGEQVAGAYDTIEEALEAAVTACGWVFLLLIPPALVLNAPRTMGAALASQGLLILLGRDVLRHCTLHYNGLVGEFTLSL